MIAALFVQRGGCYWDIPGVDPWDEQRDARTYWGPHPVVAHPPCARWCRLAGLVEARWGHKRGKDGGCFSHALAAVLACGGVLEHPAYSDAWEAYGLPRPDRRGGWIAGAGGHACHVEQGRYGHRAKKATWLFANARELPDLVWGARPDRYGAMVSWCDKRTYPGVPRLSKREAAATPTAFRDVLLSIARSCL